MNNFITGNRRIGREALFESNGFDPFFNVNTPEDLARAEAMIAEFDL